MIHEKIIKRSDGTRIQIEVKLNYQFGRDIEYWVRVFKCDAGKRTWRNVINTDLYEYRKLSMEERRIYEVKKQLEFVSVEEIKEAKLELWQKLKP